MEVALEEAASAAEALEVASAEVLEAEVVPLVGGNYLLLPHKNCNRNPLKVKVLAQLIF